MGEQLDLFGDKPARPQEPVAPAPEPLVPVVTEPGPLPGQMDLFGDRWLRASAALKALESFDLDLASEALREAVRLYPSDADLLGQANLVAGLAGSLQRAGASLSGARAMAAIEQEVPGFLGTYWHRSLAELMEEEGGSGAVLDGVPAGLHWLRAGDTSRAEESLRATLSCDAPNCRARAYLADALFVRGRQSEARMMYRDALASLPLEVDIAAVVDMAVRDLPCLAGEEYELPEPWVEWAAAVGLLEGVFIPPSDIILNPDAALLPGLRFYRWMVAERAARTDADRIACRRAMKALSPRLMREVVERK